MSSCSALLHEGDYTLDLGPWRKRPHSPTSTTLHTPPTHRQQPLKGTLTHSQEKVPLCKAQQPLSNLRVYLSQFRGTAFLTCHQPSSLSFKCSNSFVERQWLDGHASSYSSARQGPGSMDWRYEPHTSGYINLSPSVLSALPMQKGKAIFTLKCIITKCIQQNECN